MTIDPRFGSDAWNSEGDQHRLRRGLRLLDSALGPLAGLAAVILFFAVADGIKEGKDTFLSLRNARAISVQTTTVAVAALGMTLVIIAGGIDLSAGTALALAATVLAHGLKQDWGIAAALAACLACSTFTGLFNGALISALRVPPFIVTLGTMTAYLGIAKLIANETTVRPSPAQVPDWLPAAVSTLPQATGLAGGVWLLLALACVLGLTLRYTVFGRYVFALGSNEATARLCGINVPLLKMAVYSLAGLFVGIAAVYQFSRIEAGNPTSGSGMELRIIAAVVIGGASLRGGRGSVLGTLAGAAMIRVIDSGCTQMDWKNPIQEIVLGSIVIAAVTLDRLRGRGNAD